jgi:putative ABC transport system permease protein
MSNSGALSLRPIVAKDQVRLGAGRGFRLAMSGMSYRMFRSTVTIAILSLATAFMVHMLSYGLVQHATERGALVELLSQRRLGQELTHLGDVDSELAILDALAAGLPERLREYSRWSSLGDAKAVQAQAIARRLREAGRALDDFPVAARAVVLGDSTAQEFLISFEVGDLSRLEAQLVHLGVRSPLGNFSGLKRLIIDELPQLRAFAKAAQSGQKNALEELNRSFSGKSIVEVLCQLSPALADRIRAVGFELTSKDLEDLSRLASRTTDIKSVNRLLQNGEVSTEIGRLASIEASQVNFESVSEYVKNSSRASAVGKWLTRAGAPPEITPQRLLDLTTTHRHEVKLARALGNLGEDRGAGWFGLSERNQWLVVLSFLVCVVGVANAMLMSVTERFTEIATMKCLGAMDGFVMLMFVFEAMIQGVVGGIIGLILGVILATIRAAVEYGSLLAGATGVVLPVALAMLVSLVVGVALAAVAAVGPAWLAARLSPMEAMRVE